jgi:hypothetical protein
MTNGAFGQFNYGQGAYGQGGAQYKVSASAAEFTLSGQDAGLFRHLVVPAAAGSFSLTGYAVLLTVNSTFRVLTLDGSDAAAGTIITL